MQTDPYLNLETMTWHCVKHNFLPGPQRGGRKRVFAPHEIFKNMFSC